MVWQSAVRGVKHSVDVHRQPRLLPPCSPQALVPLWHNACAVSLVDTGHTEFGLAMCLLRVPGRGSVGLALPLVLPFSGAEVKICT